MNSLADVLSKTERNEEARALRLDHGRGLRSQADLTPLQLRQLALTCYREGQYVEAVNLLRGLLKDGFEAPSCHVHLARVLIMLNRLEEAREEVAHALGGIGEATPYVCQRALYLEALFALLDGRQPDESLWSIAVELARPEAFQEWDLEKMLEAPAPEPETEGQRPAHGALPCHQRPESHAGTRNSARMAARGTRDYLERTALSTCLALVRGSSF